MPLLPIDHNPNAGSKSHNKQRVNKQSVERNQGRALPTYSKEWRNIRNYILLRDPLCIKCAEAGTITPSVDVDHIDGDNSNNDYSNLQGLCKSCHSKKTYLEKHGETADR